jgi:hypothetical protein
MVPVFAPELTIPIKAIKGVVNGTLVEKVVER